MKRIMFSIITALLAIGVQAASMNWSSGVFSGADGSSSRTGVKYSGVYTAVISIFADEGGTTLLGTDSSDAVSKNGLIKGTVDIEEPASGVTKTFYAKLVITDKDGKTLESTMGSFTWTGGDLASPSLTFYGDNASGFVTQPTASASGWSGGSSGDVPEPTSGILFLVGGAMLALRRKQK